MSTASDDFEQKITELYRVLCNSNDEVKWNDRMMDPDNPDQLRQIDISIKNGEYITHIECRLRNSKQDVKWIEELQGRKNSLGIQRIVGVSSSGFTKGAILKAKRFGIALRDTREFKNDDIQSWGKVFSLDWEYLLFDKFRVGLLTTKEANETISTKDLARLFTDMPEFKDNLLKSVNVNEIREYFIKSGKNESTIAFRLILNNCISIHGFTIRKIQVVLENVRLVKEQIFLEKPMYYTNSDSDKPVINAYIQKILNKGGYFVASHKTNRLIISPDKWKLPDNSIFCGLNFKFSGGDIEIWNEIYAHTANNDILFQIGLMVDNIE